MPQAPRTLADSMQALVGGGVRVRESPRLLGLLHRLLPGRGQRTGLLGMAFPRSTVLMRDAGDRETLAHEFGHIADFRRSFPEVERDVKAATPEGESPVEHFADVYMTAVTFLQGEGSRAPGTQRAIQALDRSLPGFQEVVGALLRHPLYERHPLNEPGNVPGGLLGVVR
jgi:hypothetical protein